MNRTSESGVFLVHAVFISAITGLIGFAFISSVLSENITSRAYLLAERTIIQAETTLEKVAWMLATPRVNQGWGIRMTTAPSGESIDEALAAGHFTELDGAKVIVQRTTKPWERRVSLLVESSDGRIGANRTIQSSVMIRVSGNRLPDGDVSGTALVALDPSDSVEVPATLVSTDLTTRGPSPAVWVGHNRELSLWDSTVSGDIWSHLPISMDPWSSLAGDAVVAAFHDQNIGAFPELVPSTVQGEDLMSDEEMFMIQGFEPHEEAARMSAVVCSDSDGRMHVSIDGMGCGSDIDLLLDRWSEPPKDGVLAVVGDVTVDGAIPDGWVVVAAGGPNCARPCGHLTYLATGVVTGGASGLSAPSSKSNPLIIGGSVEIVATATDAVLSADVFSSGSTRSGVVPALGGSGIPVLNIHSMIVSGGAIRLGGPDHRVSFDRGLRPSDALEISRTGIRPKASIRSWKEVLPAPK